MIIICCAPWTFGGKSEKDGTRGDSIPLAGFAVIALFLFFFSLSSLGSPQ